MRTDAHEPRLPRWELGVVFALNGLMFGAWFPYINIIKAQLGLEEAQLGLALFGLPAGLVTGVGAGRWLRLRLGSRPIILIGVSGYCAGMALPGLAGDHYWLALALYVPGLFNGMLDPAAGLEVNKFEGVTGRALQGYFMGIFSMGQVVQALVVPGAIQLGVPPAAYLGGCAAVGLIAAGVVSVRLMRAVPLDLAETESNAAGRRGLRWWRWALALAALFLAAGVVEGIWADWHGVYLSGDDIGATYTVAALGYTCFQITSVVARVGHAPLVDRLAIRYDPLTGRGKRRATLAVLRVAIAIALVGAVLIVTAEVLAMALVGAVLLGLGVGPVGPLAVSAAGEDEGAVSLANAFGYTSLVAAPAVIGFVADALTLRTALWALVGAGVLMAVTSAGVGPHPGRHRRET